LNVAFAADLPPVLFTATEQVTLKLRPATGELTLTSDGEKLPFAIVKKRGDELTVCVPKLPPRAGAVRVDFAGQEPRFIPLLDCFRVALSFDDGPAQGGDDGRTASPTLAVLRILADFRHGANNRGAAAIFFVLTSPDTFLRDTFKKGETAAGGEILREIDRQGHVIGVHWGGGYGKQTTTHPRHAALPAANSWQNNLLETELQQCLDRIEDLTGKRPRYVRPPLWKYEKDGVSCLPTYRRLGLKMLLTDAKYPDGGYKIISVWIPRKKKLFAQNLRTAFRRGEKNLLLSMHDSNTQTAAALPEILQTVKDTFAAIDWGVANPQTLGDRLRFAQTAAEIENILDDRRNDAD
jgi:peptidoglycan/xylan/chitin deacetylase (PgdA/CDA1 family)